MSKVWYGNIQNRLEERVKMPEPKVGMGVTEMCWSDRHAYEVISIKDKRHITVRRLDAIRVDNNGMSESQKYVYAPDEHNETASLFLTKKGEWREKEGRTLGCNIFVMGYAEEYYDYSF